ncbi:C25 family cysteine peptidase [Bacteroidales bacterium OttesenSCG-928-C19]|nr:C25 family cysteine peptidase [Bacteroidales bacterium OttesenSCG-928-C19]
MRKFLITIAFLLSFLSVGYAQKNVTNIIENELTLIEIENIVEDIKFEEKVADGKRFNSLNLGEQYVFSKEVGAPELPVVVKLIELPDDAKISVNIIAQTNKVLDLKGFPLCPVQPRAPKQRTPKAFLQNEKIYEKDAFWGFETVSVEEIGSLNGMRLAKITISPVKYNPVNQQIEVVDYLRVQISFKEADIQKTIERKTRINQSYNSLFEGKVVNYKNFNPKQNELPKHPFKYVIVSTTQFQKRLKAFVQWKKEKGFDVKEVYIEDPAVGNTPESIRNYLKALYNSATEDDPAATFLLIAGSNSIIPAFQKSVNSSGLYGYLDNNYSPTDLYYAEYTNDIYPEVFYGRFPANNVGELENMIRKTIAYEKYQMLTLEKTYLQNITLIAGKESSLPAPLATNGTINYLKNNYFDKDVDTVLFYNPQTSRSKNAILTRIGEGNSMIYYTGHCSASGLSWALGDGYVINGDDINQSLTNTEPYFFSVNNCCLSNKYDLKNKSCFGEELIKNSIGAIGVIGASNETLWDEDFYWAAGAKSLSVSPLYNSNALGAFDMFFHTHDEKLSQQYITQGQMLSAGNLAVTQSGSAYEQYYWEIYCLFGDPSLMPYVGMPKQLSIQIPTSIDKGTDSIFLTGDALSYVSIMDDTVRLAAGLLNESGEGEFRFKYPVIHNNSLKVVATKQFCQSYFGTIPVNTPTASKMIFSAYSLFDENGDSLQKLKSEKELQLKLQLKNVGQQVSSGKMTIESTDTNIVFKNNEFAWEDISQNQTIETNIFLFDVDEINTKTIEFKITVEENDVKKDNHFTIATEDIRLEYSNIEIEKNNSGIAIKARLRNIGKDAAKNIKLYAESKMVDEIEITFDETEYSVHDLSFLDEDEVIIKLQSPNNIFKRNYLTIELKSVCDGRIFSKELKIPLNRAIEGFESNSFASFNWENISTYPWIIEKNKTNVFEGSYCAKSGAIGHDKKSTLSIELDVIENDSIHFMYKVSSERESDFLTFLIDADVKEQWAGEIAWKKATYPLSAGKHKLTWQYNKDMSDYFNTGKDCAWIDNIQFPLSANILSIDGQIPKDGDVKIYPNPTNGIIYVDFNQDSSIYTAYIYDSYGKLLIEKTPFNRGDQLNLKHLSSGVYMLILKADKKRLGQKIIVTK